MKFLRPILLLTLGIFCLTLKASAQGEQKFITFSGFVIDGSTDQPLPGTRVMNEQSGKGIYSNEKGYFILDVFPGDTLVFYFLGFKAQYHVIPKNTGLTYSAVVELSVDAKMLKPVKVYPFRTEEEFKLAFLSMDAPNDEERRILEKNLGSGTLRSIAMSAPMSSMNNYRYAMDQQLTHLQNQKLTTMNPFFNAGSWINFIRTVKNGNFVKSFTSGNNSSSVNSEKNSREEIFRSSKD